MFSLCVVFALTSISVGAKVLSMPLQDGLLAQNYGSNSAIVGRYYSDDISMSDMPGGSGYYFLELKSNNNFILSRCCSFNGAAIERYTGEYKFIYNNGEGAGALWINGNRIGTFITTSTGIRLGTIDMKKK